MAVRRLDRAWMRGWDLWAFFAIFLVTRALDVVSTYMGSPNLEGERNYVFLVFGGGWGLIFSIQASIIVALGVGTALAVRLRPVVQPPRAALSFRAWMSWLAFGAPRPFHRLLYRFPSGWRRNVYCGTVGLLGAGVVAGAAVSAHNFALVLRGANFLPPWFYDHYWLPAAVVASIGMGVVFAWDHRRFRSVGGAVDPA